ncbi:MAG TPA: transglutaminase-like domain-containing protein [Thermoanaerobaculia bacterium]|nr:transglutaminase-like domain-containing protein [Thermoanaerobaculia bacterium]
MRATLLLLLLSLPAGATERWYVFSMGGTPVGYAVEDVDGAKTRNEVFARLTRLGKSIEMRLETNSVESATGELQSLTFEAVLSKQPVRLEARVEGDEIVIVTPPHERRIARGANPLLGPRAVARLSAEKLRAAGSAIEYSVFSPELQRVARVKRTAIAAEAACDGTRAMKVEEAIEGLPATRMLWIDESGVSVGDDVAGPFGAMRTCRTTRETALAANGTLPTDAYEKTLARSNIRFADPFAIDRVVLQITRNDATLPLPALAAHNQKIVRQDDDRVIVEVRRDGGEAKPADEYLKPNALIESEHPEIVKVAKELVRSTPRETAQALTRWVAENMSMDGGIVMAPASELIRDRRATCMGYATLLASLARAAGIPSRIAMGYVYYGGIWGGHAWTEVILDDRWVPLDAAVYTPGVASAARFAAGTSSFAEGGGELNAALGTLFGRVDVDVLEYDAGGRTTRVAADAKPFEIAKDAYVNPGLGLTIPAKGWTIERADATWPSSLVVAFRRGDDVVELHHRPRYPEKTLPRDGESMFVDANGGMLWVWSARGPGASATLRTFVR